MSSDIWNDIAAKKADLDGRRPLPPEILARLDAWYDVELTYTSNAIEGNTLTRQETAIVLEKGITVRGKPLKDHMEALDHRDAWHFVKALASRGEPIREADVRAIHALVLGRSDKDKAGRYSVTTRLITGSRMRPPPPHDVPILMEVLMRWLETAPASADTAFDAHWRLVAIHPFDDGNGRTARLLMNLLMVRAGYPPLLIETKQRPDYIDLLDRLGHAEPPAGLANLAARYPQSATGAYLAYRAFMAERLHDSLTLYLDILGAPS